MVAGILKDVRPHHFCIAVPDIERAIVFWTEVFGFSVRLRHDIPAIRAKGAFLESTGIDVELFELASVKPVPEERKQPNSDLLTSGSKHIAFHVPDVQAAINELVKHDVKVVAVRRDRNRPMEAEADPTGSRKALEAFIQDPFGSLIELVGPESD